MSLSSRLKRGVSGFVEGFVFGFRSTGLCNDVEKNDIEDISEVSVQENAEDQAKKDEELVKYNLLCDKYYTTKEELSKYNALLLERQQIKSNLDSAIQELNKTKTFSVKTTESVVEGAAAADSFFEVVRTVITEVLGCEKFDDDFAYALKKLLDFSKQYREKSENPLSEEEMKEVVSELVLVADPNFDKPRHDYMPPCIAKDLTEEDRAEYNRAYRENLTEDETKHSKNIDAEKLERTALRDKAIEDFKNLSEVVEETKKTSKVVASGNGPIFKDYNIELKAMLDNGAPQEEVSALQEFIEDVVERSMPGKVTPPVPVPEGFVKESLPPPPAEFFTEEEKELLNVKFHETVEDIKALVEKERARKEKKAAGRRARYNEAIQRFKKARKALGVKLNNP